MNMALDFIPTARPAAARNRPLAVNRIIVGELFASADVAPGADPNRLVDDLEPAVRRAGVVDEPRDVCAGVRIAAPGAAHPVDPDPALGEIPFLARPRWVVRH